MLWVCIVAGGRRFVTRHHDWNRIGEHLQALLHPHVAHRRAARAAEAGLAGR